MDMPINAVPLKKEETTEMTNAFETMATKTATDGGTFFTRSYFMSLPNSPLYVSPNPDRNKTTMIDTTMIPREPVDNIRIFLFPYMIFIERHPLDLTYDEYMGIISNNISISTNKESFLKWEPILKLMFTKNT